MDSGDALGVQEPEQLPVRDVQLGEHLLVPRVGSFTFISGGASLERRHAAAQLGLARSVFLPELEGGVELEWRAMSVPGCSAAMTACALPLASVRVAERLEVERSGHQAHRGRVVDDAQAVRRESPAHLDVDRVVEALIVQAVADEQRALARDPTFPEAPPVELLAVARAARTRTSAGRRR